MSLSLLIADDWSPSHQSGHQSVSAACRKLELKTEETRTEPLSLLGESRGLPLGHRLRLEIGDSRLEIPDPEIPEWSFWRQCCQSTFSLSQSVSQTLGLAVIVIVTTPEAEAEAHRQPPLGLRFASLWLQLGFGCRPGRFTNKWKWICLLYILLLPKRKRRITSAASNVQFQRVIATQREIQGKAHWSW